MNPYRRWEYGNGYKHNQYFDRAIRRYGWDNFEHQILYSGLSKEDAEAKERELINRYHTTNRDFGYNLTSGGEVGKRHSPESRDKMSKAKIGKYSGKNNPMYGTRLSYETRQKISKALIGKFAGEKNPNYGKPMSSEQKEKISRARKGRHFPKLSESMKSSAKRKEITNNQKIPVDQYTRSGDFLMTWDSAADASTELLGHRRGQSNICSCANGKLKTAYGYVWKHHEAGKEGSEVA